MRRLPCAYAFRTTATSTAPATPAFRTPHVDPVVASSGTYNVGLEQHLEAVRDEEMLFASHSRQTGASSQS